MPLWARPIFCPGVYVIKLWCHILLTNPLTLVYHMIRIENYPCGRAGERAGKFPYLFLLMAMKRHMQNSMLKAIWSCFLNNVKSVYNQYTSAHHFVQYKVAKEQLDLFLSLKHLQRLESDKLCFLLHTGQAYKRKNISW